MAAKDFEYDGVSGKRVPIPPAEKGLRSAKAKELYTVSSQKDTLEGAIFDAEGNLLFCNPTAGKVFKLSPDNKLTEVIEIPDFAPGGIALHKDGRLFIAALNLGNGVGQILALSPDGKTLETILPIDAGYLPKADAFKM